MRKPDEKTGIENAYSRENIYIRKSRWHKGQIGKDLSWKSLGGRDRRENIEEAKKLAPNVLTEGLLLKGDKFQREKYSKKGLSMGEGGCI